MGKMIRVNERDGWQVWPTPYWFYVRGVHMTKRWAFKGTRYAHNRRRRPLRASLSERRATMVITWADRVANLTKALGRKPTLTELIDAAQIHQMTPEEIEAQRQSWVRGMTARCEHGELDFEQCPKCRPPQQK